MDVEPSTSGLKTTDSKQIFVIPDIIHGQLICFACKQYLSVLPVKICEGSIIKCGRCSTTDGGVKSLCNLLLAEMSFKCINHYEGCNCLLPADLVLKHEVSCKKSKIGCPSCNRFSGNTLQLLSHFRLLHPDYILEKNEFTFGTDENFYQSFLYIDNGRLFFIIASYDASDAQVSVRFSCVGNYKALDKPRGNFELHVHLTDQFYSNEALLFRKRRIDDTATVFKLNMKKIPKPVWKCRFELELQRVFKMQRTSSTDDANNNSILNLDVSKNSDECLLTFKMKRITHLQTRQSPKLSTDGVEWRFRFSRNRDKYTFITLEGFHKVAPINIKVNAKLSIMPTVDTENCIIVYWNEVQFNEETRRYLTSRKNFLSQMIFGENNIHKYVDQFDSITCKGYVQVLP